MSSPTAHIAISKLGTYQAMDGRSFRFTPEIFRDLVDSYDPELRAAPLVVGHPQLDDPAYGWARKLSTDGVKLHAEPHQVEASFAELVNTGRYPNVSMAIYLPDAPGNPKPGRHYLKHIGFLGATQPAVPGLGAARLDAAHFAEGDGALEFAFPASHFGNMVADLFQRMRDHFIERDGLEKADAIIPQWQIRSIAEITAEPAAPANPAFAAPGTSLETEDMTTAAQFAEREAAIDTREAAITAREAAIVAQEAAAHRTSVVEFAAALVTAGKLLPAEQASVVEVLVSVEGAQALSFAEAGQTVTKSASQILREFLDGLPVRIKFGEKSGAQTAPAIAHFAAPAGMQIDPVAADLYARARAYQQDHPEASFDAAVTACGGR